jgi:fructose/tagatose bisphosphate aldolase
VTYGINPRVKIAGEIMTSGYSNMRRIHFIYFDIEEQSHQVLSMFSKRLLKVYVDMINDNGGSLKDSVGIPEEQLRKATKSAVCKINIDSDGRLAMTATIRKVLNEKPGEFDPRKYLGPAREALKQMYMYKNINVLGSANQG